MLPVLLATVGPRLDWPRIRKEGSRSRAGPPGLVSPFGAWDAALVGIAALTAFDAAGRSSCTSVSRRPVRWRTTAAAHEALATLEARPSRPVR